LYHDILDSRHLFRRTIAKQYYQHIAYQRLTALNNPSGYGMHEVGRYADITAEEIMKKYGVFVLVAAVAGCIGFSRGAYAQDPPQGSAQEQQAATDQQGPASVSFFDLLNNKAYADQVDKESERDIVRRQWTDALGIDVFYPYFEVKKVENFVKEKTRVKIWDYKGSAEFDENSVNYTFKRKF
jgi:hypothetical protein